MNKLNRKSLKNNLRYVNSKLNYKLKVQKSKKSHKLKSQKSKSQKRKSQKRKSQKSKSQKRKSQKSKSQKRKSQKSKSQKRKSYKLKKYKYMNEQGVEVIDMAGFNNDYVFPTVAEVIQSQLTNQNFINVTPDVDRGSSNFVNTFENARTGESRSVRMSLQPVADYEQELIITSDNAKIYNETVGENDELRLSRENWLKSSEIGIAPRLYFYGYVRKSDLDKTLFLLIINEGFQTNLGKFYKNIFPRFATGNLSTELTPTDINIQKQLTEQLFKISTEMQLVCYDIKPANTVINWDSPYDHATFESPLVKLIDWDADFCLKYGQRFSKNIGGKNRAKYAGILSNIVMANIFLVTLDRNIFRDYFRKNKKEFDRIKPKLFNLFCEGWNWKLEVDGSVKIINEESHYNPLEYSSIYHKMSNFYLNPSTYTNSLTKSRCIDVPGHIITIRKCHILFNEMYKRCYILNSDEFTELDISFDMEDAPPGISEVGELVE